MGISKAGARITCILASVSLLNATALAQAGKIITVAISPPDLTETTPATVDTAGEEFVGLAGGGLNDSITKPDIIVSGIRESDKTICVYLQRSSGLYKGNFKYSITSETSQIKFEIKSKSLGKTKFAAAEVAIKAQASASDRCNSAAAYLPVKWAQTKSNALQVFFNSKQATDVQAKTAEGSYVNCQNLRDATNNDRLSIRSFDTVCTVPAELKCNSNQQIKVMRSDGLAFDKPSSLSLRSTC